MADVPLSKSTRACRNAASAHAHVLALFSLLVMCSARLSAQVEVPGAADTRTGPPLSVGGEVRYQYEWFDNEEWGAEVPDSNGYLLQRFMLHLDARLSRRLRLYGELKSGIEIGRAGGPRGSDEDRLDLHQGFADLSMGPLTVRLGRQELAFGTQRLVGVREGPNVRHAFDGGNVIIQANRWRADAFATRYVGTETGVFDDSPDTGRSLWGVYAVRSLAPDRTRGLDLYYLGYRRTSATFDQGRGREVRHSWGARAWRTATRLDYNFETVFQTGRFAGATIRAWALGSDTGYRPGGLPWRPRLGLRANVTSGDRDRHDDRLGTFNPMFPRGAYFGLIASAGPSNQMDLHPTVTFSPDDDFQMTTGWLFFWRHRIDDGIYAGSGSLLRSAAGTRSRFVGHSPGLEVKWQVTRPLLLTGQASVFTAGPFIRESGPARTTGFVAAWATLRF